MVALYYPKKFEVRRASGGGGGGSGLGMFSDFYPGQWGLLSSEYGLGYGAYGVPFFFGANGYYQQPGEFYFVPGSGGGGPTPAQETHGQVVNGQGYTRVQTREPYRGTATSSGGSGQTASSTGGNADSGGGASSSSAGSSGSSGVSSGGYSSGGGGSTGLTAVPR